MVMILIAHRNKTKAEFKLHVLEVKKQKEIAENTLITQERERQQLGLELHDDLGPSFSAVRLFVQQIDQKVASRDYDDLPRVTKIISETLNDAIQKFSDVSRILYPSVLHRLGLNQALQDIIDRCNSTAENMKFTLEISIGKIQKELITLTIYRLVQELSNNAVKHSKAGNVAFTLSESKDDIHMQYGDDGVGFDIGQQYEGLGMKSIRGRVEALGGTIEMTSRKNNGLGLSLTIPKIRN